MASYSLYLVTISLIIFSYQPFLLVESDDALIQNLCSKTSDPSVCLDCLQSDANSQTADAKGLAKISINCAEFDTNLLYNQSYELWENTSDSDLPLKSMLDQCSQNTFLARESYHGVRVYVEQNAIDAAKLSVNNDIIAFVQRCMDQFNNNPTIPVPQRILAGIVIVNQDCQVVLGILNSLAG